MPNMNQAPAPKVSRVWESPDAVAVTYDLNHDHASVVSWVNSHEDHPARTRMDVDLHATACETKVETRGFSELEHGNAFVSVVVEALDSKGRKVVVNLYLTPSQAEDLQESLPHATAEAAGQTKLEV